MACLLVLNGCSATMAVPPTATPSATIASPPQPVLTQAVSSPIPIVTETAVTATVASSSAPQVCSPLAGITIDKLPAVVSNPYRPPRIGSDDPHQGVDLADRSPGSNVAVGGRTVQAALTGQIAMRVNDRFPYGNAVLIETPLEATDLGVFPDLQLPTPAPTLAMIPALTCPTPGGISTVSDQRSLYLLYAHMAETPALKLGDTVGCGQAIGTVGATGNALNPHLHLEVRVGPSGIRFTSMAHYLNSATQEEMANYCAWRISELFQTLDPLTLFGSHS